MAYLTIKGRLHMPVVQTKSNDVSTRVSSRWDRVTLGKQGTRLRTNLILCRRSPTHRCGACLPPSVAQTGKVHHWLSARPARLTDCFSCQFQLLLLLLLPPLLLVLLCPG